MLLLFIGMWRLLLLLMIVCIFVRLGGGLRHRARSRALGRTVLRLLMPTASADLMQRILLFLQVFEMRFKRHLLLRLLLLVDRFLALDFWWFILYWLLFGWLGVADRT